VAEEIAEGPISEIEPMAGCDCSMCTNARILEELETEPVSPSTARSRATRLLMQYLTPEQAEDWEANHAINVRGSNGHLWRITPTCMGEHRSMIRDDGVGTAVWPIGLSIRADFALAMKLELESNEQRVFDAGCHDRYMGTCPRPHDYDGAL
jgi:hypothetical protein